MKSARISALLLSLFLCVPACLGSSKSSSYAPGIVDAINQASAMPQPLPKEVEKAKELEPEGDLQDFYLEFTGKFRPEMFYGKNMEQLNNLNNDEVWYMRHTLDFNVHTQYGKKTYGCNVLETKFAIRDKAVWGNPRTIASTTDTPVKILADVTSNHRHFLTKHIFWMREGWLEFDLNHALSLYSLNKHSFTLGLFSFELGRGIALGDAFAVGPELLGFYSDALVDQYAPGLKLTGQIMCDWLTYDIYGAILENFSSSTRDTTARIFTQQVGRLNPERGFGAINYVVAARLNITPVKNDFAEWTVEPYIMYNSDPEVDIEFTADASSKLGTAGIASEFYGDTFEFGFDTAFNFGRQFVKPWDRNHVETRELNGRLVQVNSHVYVGTDPSVANSNLSLYKAVIANKPIQVQTPQLSTTVNPIPPTPINNVNDQITKFGSQATSLIASTPKGCCQNGQQIGTVAGYSNAVGGLPPASPTSLQDVFFNAPDSVDFGRFRDGYTNKYQGFMFVADWTYWIYKKELSVSGTVGIATGDDDPNNEEVDGNYKGFVPLQEVYNGKRVQSAFTLGGSRLKRPLTVPTPEQNSDQFAETLNAFTNIAFVGGALKWEPKTTCKKFKLYPNVLFYWEPFPAKIFDLNLNRSINERSRSFLGVEFNAFIDYYIFENTRTYFVGAVFVPGAHYYDIKGLPISDSQAMFLNRLNDSNTPLPARLPGLGTDTAWTFNLGIEYKF